MAIELKFDEKPWWVAAIWGVVEATARAGGGELALIAAQEELAAPSRTLVPQKL